MLVKCSFMVHRLVGYNNLTAYESGFIRKLAFVVDDLYISAFLFIRNGVEWHSEKWFFYHNTIGKWSKSLHMLATFVLLCLNYKKRIAVDELPSLVNTESNFNFPFWCIILNIIFVFLKRSKVRRNIMIWEIPTIYAIQ